MTRVGVGLALLVLLGACAAPQRGLVAYVTDLRGIYEENSERPREGIVATRDYLRAQLPAAEAAAARVQAQIDALSTPKDRRERSQETMDALEPAITALDAARRTFEARAAADPTAVDTLTALGADDVATLFERHDTLLGTLLRFLRRSLAFTEAGAAEREAKALADAACDCKDRDCILDARKRVQAFVLDRLRLVDASSKAAVRRQLDRAKACVKADPSQFD